MVGITAELDCCVGAFRLRARIDLPDHRITGLTGRSGAGKTTLIAALLGLRRMQAGSVKIGCDTLYCATKRINVPCHRRGLGCVFQHGRLFPHLKVIGNLLYGHRFARAGAPDPDELIELLGISHLRDRTTHTLSGGERQRVALGRAMIAGPRALLLDEPLSGLDESGKKVLLSVIQRIASQSAIPVLYASHDRQELMHLTDTVLHIKDGVVPG